MRAAMAQPTRPPCPADGAALLTPRLCSLAEPAAQRTPRLRSLAAPAAQRTPRLCSLAEPAAQRTPRLCGLADPAAQLNPRPCSVADPPAQRTPRLCSLADPPAQLNPRPCSVADPPAPRNRWQSIDHILRARSPRRVWRLRARAGSAPTPRPPRATGATRRWAGRPAPRATVCMSSTWGSSPSSWRLCGFARPVRGVAAIDASRGRWSSRRRFVSRQAAKPPRGRGVSDVGGDAEVSRASRSEGDGLHVLSDLPKWSDIQVIQRMCGRDSNRWGRRRGASSADAPCERRGGSCGGGKRSGARCPGGGRGARRRARG